MGNGLRNKDNHDDLEREVFHENKPHYCGDCSLYPGEGNTCDIAKLIRPNIHLTLKGCKYFTQATQEQIHQHLADAFDKVETMYGSLNGLNINDLFDKEE